jgi:hypothetical protein
MPDKPAKRIFGFSWGHQEKVEERLATPEELAEYGAIAPDPAVESKILALFEEQLVQDLVKKSGLGTAVAEPPEKEEPVGQGPESASAPAEAQETPPTPAPLVSPDTTSQSLVPPALPQEFFDALVASAEGAVGKEQAKPDEIKAVVKAPEKQDRNQKQNQSCKRQRLFLRTRTSRQSRRRLTSYRNRTPLPNRLRPSASIPQSLLRSISFRNPVDRLAIWSKWPKRWTSTAAGWNPAGRKARARICREQTSWRRTSPARICRARSCKRRISAAWICRWRICAMPISSKRTCAKRIYSAPSSPART